LLLAGFVIVGGYQADGDWLKICVSLYGTRNREYDLMSTIGVTIDGSIYNVEVQIASEGEGAYITALVNGETLRVAVPLLESLDEFSWIIVDNRPYELVVDRELHWIQSHSGRHRLNMQDLEAAVARPVSGEGRIKAPIPGLITRVLVAPGDHVEAGQPLLVLEAMKMENEIRAPRSGTLDQLLVRAGQGVALHEVLAEIV
jgi:biotin carboxyl carrier protein